MKPPADLCILISVYHPYRWMAPHMWRLMNQFWPDHPPLFFCGLTSEEAGDLPHIPCRQTELPRVWGRFVHEAAIELKSRGFNKCYFLLEDHPPLAECHAEHLNHTLPALMDRLGASYIGLMGWDNRRFTTKAPLLGEADFRLMHLNTPRAPRFHLHPSLFTMDAFIACLGLLVTTEKPTPWGFEKTCDKADAALPEAYKRACYQINGERLALHPPGPLGRVAHRAERFVYHRLMAPVPLLYRFGLGPRYWRLLGFDDYFYNGPFPMFYAGVMAAGRINPYFVRYLQRHPEGAAAFRDLLAEAVSHS